MNVLLNLRNYMDEVASRLLLVYTVLVTVMQLWVIPSSSRLMTIFDIYDANISKETRFLPYFSFFQTSPMRFYYRIYQKTKVLTRKRKSKKTKTNSKGQPSKKRRNIESAEVASGVAPRSSENGMEIEEESRKASSNLRTDSGEERGRAGQLG